MPESITIATGLPADDPWVIKDTNKNLQNLAVGTLASLSGEQAAAVNTQTASLSETVAKVDRISDRLNTISNLTTVTVLDLNVPDRLMASQLTLPKPYFFDEDANKDLQPLFSLTEKLNAEGINYGGYDAYLIDAVAVIPFSTKLLVAGPLVTFSSIEEVDNASLTVGQIYTYPSLQTGGVEYRIYGVNNYTILNFDSSKGIVIPRSQYELNQWSTQKTDFSKIKNFVDSLKDGTILVANTNPEGLPDNALTMAVKTGVENMIEVDFLGKKYYRSLPLEVIDLTTLTKRLDKDTIFINSSDGKTLITGYGQRSYYAVVPENQIKKFINPDKNEIASWRSQYAEKQVILTQKASEQGLFLNELVQKYNYFSDAATNVLKAFTNLKNQLINNL